MIEITIPASQLEEGDTLVFLNERFNRVVEEVTFTRYGDVRVTSGNDTCIEFYESNERVTVCKC